jgi:hypothetical protein
MKPEHEEYLERIRRRDWYGEQDENGVDLSLIRAQLELTPTQRLRMMDHETTAMLELRNHVRPVHRAGKT